MQVFRQNQHTILPPDKIKFWKHDFKEILFSSVFQDLFQITNEMVRQSCVRDDLITLDLLWFIFLWITHSLSLIQSVSSTLMLCFIVTWLRFKDQNFLSHQRHECSGPCLHVNRVNLDPRWTNTQKTLIEYRWIPNDAAEGVYSVDSTVCIWTSRKV